MTTRRREGRIPTAVAITFLLGAWSGPAHAHEFRAGQLTLTPLASEHGPYIVEWVPPGARSALGIAGLRRGDGLTVHFPDGCTEREARLHCGAGGLTHGTLSIEGLGPTDDVVVRVRGDRPRTAVLTAAAPALALDGATAESSWTHYLARGVEHVLSGLDHLLFVLGMVWIVCSGRAGQGRPARRKGGPGIDRATIRRLLATITAFTVAHSLSLIASVLGWVRLASPPVEATIALSVLLLAVEAARGDSGTATWRWPWAVAFAFGLVHGLGFAGALLDLEVPRDALVGALAGFNLGVEAGQIGVVALLLAVARLSRHRPWLRRWGPWVPYAMGAMAAAWTIERCLRLGGPA
jgi:hydrogenase/urease accessory protein HupE